MKHSLFQLEIPRRSSLCFKGQERLEVGMDYYSLLLQQENVIRRDFCSACWSEVDLAHSLGYWKSRVESKKASLVPKEQSRTARALAVLKALLQAPQKQEDKIFILALFLARARCLILRQEREQEEGTYLLYEVVNQDEILMIKKLEISQINVEEIQQSLAKAMS